MNHLHFKEIHLKNFATFENERVRFNPSFNCIIGETGSGKSLVAEAIQIILGARVEKNFIRKGTKFCVLEAELACNDKSVINYLNEIGFPCENDSVYIKRIVNLEGPNKSFINGSYCSSQTLKDFSKRYIDLVGQFQNQKLLSPSYQLKLVDHFINSKVYESYLKEFKQLSIFNDKKETLQKDFEHSSDQEDFLRFQVTELEKVQDILSEEALLIKEKDRFLIRQNDLKTKEEITQILSGDNGSGVEDSLNRLAQLIKADSKLKAKYENSLESSIALINDINYEVNNKEDDFDDSRLSEILDDLDRIQKLKRKHNCNADELIEKLQSIQLKLTIINSYRTNLEKVEQDILLQTETCNKLASKIHKQRIDSSIEISKKLNIMLAELNMKGCKVKIELQLLDHLTTTGKSKLNFMIETNPGEGFYNLNKTASGGELSRILLCLRRVIASKDSISIFFFDEIDTGIGGQTAKKIGAALASIAETGQVIAITHLPQIAQYTNLLIDVQKSHKKASDGLRTISCIETFTAKGLERKVKEMVPLDI